jgi:glucokinase
MKSVARSLITAVGCTAVAIASAAATAAEPTACAELTPAAFDALESTLSSSLALATADCAANCTTGAYAIAAQYNRDYLASTLAKVRENRAWFTDLVLAQPYVSNASAAYGIHGLARDQTNELHHARHWATISATYHSSRDAHESFASTSLAIQELEFLGEVGGRCYMDQYGPFDLPE